MDGELPPGRWRVVCYPSGTICVSDGRTKAAPYGVQGVGPRISIWYSQEPAATESEQDIVRLAAAEDIALRLNTGAGVLPISRTGEQSGKIGPYNVRFSAAGPSVDRDPPKCDWWEDMRDEAVSARCRLIDRLFGVTIPDASDQDLVGDLT